MEEEINMFKHIFGWTVFAIILTTCIFGTFYIISAGERGILLTFGKPDMVPKTEGLHFKIPIVQSVVKMDIKTQKYTVEKASAASKDLQTVTTDVAINYYISPENTPIIYKTIGINYQDKVIAPAVQEVVKANTAQYTAEELITKRPEVKEKIDAGLRERLAEFNVIVQAISITNFDFSPEFNKAIESKVTTEQNALAAKNKLLQVEYEAQQRVAQAEGEAKAIQIQTQAISMNGGQSYLTLKWIERWNGQVSLVNGGSSIVDLRGINSAGYIAMSNSTQ